MLSLAKLVHHAVDYAGLFPPAGLPLDEVVRNFSLYRQLPTSSMLGRLVLPAARMEEFASLIETLALESQPGEPWRISALVPTVNEAAKFSEACRFLTEFNNAHRSRGFEVDSLEIKTDSPDDVAVTLAKLPSDFQAFLEIDCHADPSPSIGRIAEQAKTAPVFAKIRTGSIVAEQIPGIQQVARFIQACAAHSVGFKATAGLHHPLRNEYRLTYDDDPPRGIMHGFLNVFVASIVAFDQQVPSNVIEEILSDTSPASFQFEAGQICGREFQIDASRIRQLRLSSIQSFGSCSFLEPTEELQALGYQNLFATA